MLLGWPRKQEGQAFLSLRGYSQITGGFVLIFLVWEFHEPARKKVEELSIKEHKNNKTVQWSLSSSLLTLSSLINLRFQPRSLATLTALWSAYSFKCNFEVNNDSKYFAGISLTHIYYKDDY